MKNPFTRDESREFLTLIGPSQAYPCTFSGIHGEPHLIEDPYSGMRLFHLLGEAFPNLIGLEVGKGIPIQCSESIMECLPKLKRLSIRGNLQDFSGLDMGSLTLQYLWMEASKSWKMDVSRVEDLNLVYDEAEGVTVSDENSIISLWTNHVFWPKERLFPHLKTLILNHSPQKGFPDGTCPLHLKAFLKRTPSLHRIRVNRDAPLEERLFSVDLHESEPSLATETALVTTLFLCWNHPRSRWSYHTSLKN